MKPHNREQFSFVGHVHGHQWIKQSWENMVPQWDEKPQHEVQINHLYHEQSLEVHGHQWKVQEQSWENMVQQWNEEPQHREQNSHAEQKQEWGVHQWKEQKTQIPQWKAHKCQWNSKKSHRYGKKLQWNSKECTDHKTSCDSYHLRMTIHDATNPYNNLDNLTIEDAKKIISDDFMKSGKIRGLISNHLDKSKDIRDLLIPWYLKVMERETSLVSEEMSLMSDNTSLDSDVTSLASDVSRIHERPRVKFLTDFHVI